MNASTLSFSRSRGLISQMDDNHQLADRRSDAELAARSLGYVAIPLVAEGAGTLAENLCRMLTSESICSYSIDTYTSLKIPAATPQILGRNRFADSLNVSSSISLSEY